jgi:hypothetical protein
MGTRYEKETPSWVYDILNEVKENHFPELADASFYIWFDNQKRMSGGQVQLGTPNKANAKIKALTGEDYDYEIILDAEVFKNLDNAQQRHLMIHLLCHCKVVVEDEEPSFSTVSPDYPVFAKEIQLVRQWRKGWDSMRNLAAQVHAGKTGNPTNDPDHPHMFPGEGEAEGKDGEPEEEAA